MGSPSKQLGDETPAFLPQIRRGTSFKPAVISVLLHIVTAFALISIRISSPMTRALSAHERITLVAPISWPPEVGRRVVKQPYRWPSARPLTIRRRFSPPPAAQPRGMTVPPVPVPAVLVPAVPVPPFPVMDTPTAQLPVASLPVLRPIRQPVRLDNLADSSGAQSFEQPHLVTQGSFSAVEAGSGSATPRKPRSPTTFESTDGSVATAIKPAKAVVGANFGDAAVAPSSSRTVATAAGAGSAVEIVSKPKPAYTEEARRLRIEGEVLIDVLFTAAGEVRVLRLVRGLGHGLDESAFDAARHIRFRAATRDGMPADAAATVRIVFSLAY